MAAAADRDVARLGKELYNGIDKDSKAFRLMSSMGWREGEGLVSAALVLAAPAAQKSQRHNARAA